MTAATREMVRQTGDGIDPIVAVWVAFESQRDGISSDLVGEYQRLGWGEGDEPWNPVYADDADPLFIRAWWTDEEAGF